MKVHGRAHAEGRSRRGVADSRAVVLVAAVVLLAVTLFSGSPVFAVDSSPGAGAAAAETPQVLSRIPTQDKVVALTFDAGSDAGHTQEILDILEAAGIKATFFLTANWLDAYPELGAAIVARGHAIGNHTKSHPHLTQLTDEEIRAELSATEQAAQTACGRTTKPFFRPPFGEYDDRVAGVIGQAGYSYMIMWTIDSLDWKMISADELVSRVVDNIEPGAIVLMHVGSQTNEPDALPRIISQLKDQGYSFDTLPALLGTEPPEGVTYYTVKAGDTLSSIGRQFGVTVDDLITVNALKDANAIEVGQTLVIPTGTGGGDTGDSTTPGGDQGGYGSDNGGDQGQTAPHGFWAGLWAGIGRLWHSLTGFFARLFGG